MLKGGDMLTRIMELSQAATHAANTDHGKGGARFRDGAKTLWTPDVFDVDDPVKFIVWREQFVNWIAFGDPKYGEMIPDVEALDTLEPLGTVEPSWSSTSGEIMQQ